MCPAASSAVADHADLAVHHPARPDHVGAGVGLGDAPSRRSARGWRRCRPRPSASSTPQWPWSVNSSRHRSAITHGRVADLGDQVAQRDVEDAVRVDRAASRWRPCPARGRRTASARRPRPSTASAAALRSESRVCCTTPGMRRDRRAARSMPSSTNTGSTSSAGLQPGLGDQPPQRRGRPQPARPVDSGTACRPPSVACGDGLAARGCFLRGGGSAPLGRAAAARVLGQRLDQRSDRRRPRASTSTRRPNSAAVFGGRRADARDDRCGRAACRRCRPGCAPSSDEVKQHRVEPAAS